ncbi:DUF4145 domain-containing protein [Sphingomonas desiccabilis]|uniref:DUF4145 domain-containing protein n=1 Tax=Sphingomonas desiccabilis TaxID=429134 RepID=A0A4Q2IXR8_9SPHN|nr:DUF4145 domain-containing protein [Sphingomonas desiccabilis]MBB3910850.1 hypothetical protein [Sphingomonas desiccabilis]RXZ35455.1 DUF4145 domain-containing protein [Sphingomonas desiccabilis]
MAVFITMCPHCGADQMSFQIFGYKPPAASKWKTDPTLAGASCGRCDMPVSATLRYTLVQSSSDSTFASRVQGLNRPDTNLEALGFELADSWPSPPAPEAPASLPRTVERAFMQAERNRLSPDCQEAAATMYRRSLDLALKEAFPQENGMLDAKLKKLVREKRLPEAIGDWAHEVRLIGNDGAHDLEGVSQGDLLDAKAFIDTVLKYLFTLPAQIASRRPVEL